MTILILAPNPEIEARLSEAANAAGFLSSVRSCPQDMCSALYRDPEAVGVFGSESTAFAEMTVTGWRVAGVKNLVFVLLDQTGLDSDAAASARIRVLGHGADEAQPDSIDVREFVARLRALLARTRKYDEPAIKLPNGGLFTSSTGSITSPIGSVHLSRKESDLLELLTSRKDVVVTKEMILDRLYGGRDEPEPKIIDVFICKLRRKITRLLGGVDVIKTEWGRGYVFVSEGFDPALTPARTRVAG